jgi:hypothetical protein
MKNRVLEIGNDIMETGKTGGTEEHLRGERSQNAGD